ncbi:H-NS family nucleoid-associated regulatory protein [Variovorax sp. LT2P21]|uniref:H-NS family nucleoid-associated regulatory protein n=1 Tax=Variovorax sp. LT2P21 TaxID=3443731 RepID=UPI003F471925
MAQTYTQIQRQIEALQKQAEKLKASEISGVVERIKVAIEHYSLTAEQLGYGGGKPISAKPKKEMSKKGGSASRSANSAAYSDGNGNVWGGRGPRPRWLRDAIAAGRTLEEFATKATAASGTAAKAKTPKSVARKRSAKMTYRDEAGNSWSGFGPKPRWLREALEAGKDLEDLAAGSSRN